MSAHFYWEAKSNLPKGIPPPRNTGRTPDMIICNWANFGKIKIELSSCSDCGRSNNTGKSGWWQSVRESFQKYWPPEPIRRSPSRRNRYKNEKMNTGIPGKKLPVQRGASAGVQNCIVVLHSDGLTRRHRHKAAKQPWGRDITSTLSSKSANV